MRQRDRIKKQHDLWFKKIQEAKDKKAIKLFKIISNLIQKCKTNPLNFDGFKKYFNDIIDVIYDSLTETYSLASQSVKDIYDVTDSKKINIEDLVYQEDGKSLTDRIEEHCFEYYNLMINSEIDIWNELKQKIQREMLVILDTETMYLAIRVVYLKMEGHAEFCEVSSGECGCCPGFGIMPIDEVDLPPYHPQCACSVIYYEELTDDSEEIEDLDIEIEKVN